MNDPIISLVAVGLISITCQFLAYKIKLPAILPLLIAGIIVGPVTGIINADILFGDLLFPIVSLSVAIILFEGSLTLKFKDLGGHGSMVRNLCTVGALITWIIAAPIAHYAMGMSWESIWQRHSPPQTCCWCQAALLFLSGWVFLSIGLGHYLHLS